MAVILASIPPGSSSTGSSSSSSIASFMSTIEVFISRDHALDQRGDQPAGVARAVAGVEVAAGHRAWSAVECGASVDPRAVGPQLDQTMSSGSAPGLKLTPAQGGDQACPSRNARGRLSSLVSNLGGRLGDAGASCSHAWTPGRVRSKCSHSTSWPRPRCSSAARLPSRSGSPRPRRRARGRTAAGLRPRGRRWLAKARPSRGLCPSDERFQTGEKLPLSSRRCRCPGPGPSPTARSSWHRPWAGMIRAQRASS